MNQFSLQVTETTGKCAIGEKVGAQNIEQQQIPVLSCEGACIRGEIARLAANLITKEAPYRRACHGELFSVPQSAMAEWVKQAEQVVVIDGCFLHCHGRIVEHLVEEGKLVKLDALSVYKKYTDVFGIDDVPECERKAVARQVADWALEQLKGRATPIASSPCVSSCQS